MNRRDALARLGVLGHVVLAPPCAPAVSPDLGAQPRPRLTVHDATVDPARTTVDILLEWDGPLTSTVYVTLQTVNGDDLFHARNALAGLHFEPVEIREIFRIGDEPRRTVSIPLRQPMEPGQFFSLRASTDAAGFTAAKAAGKIVATPGGHTEPYPGRRAPARAPQRGRLTFSPDLPAEVPGWPDRFRHGRVQPANRELGYYVPTPYRFEGGHLVLEARKAPVEAMVDGRLETFEYRAAVVNTFGVFSQAYGYWEADCMTPGARGAWGAFWLLPAGRSWWPPEIDVFEHPRNGRITPGLSTATQHWKDAGGRKRSYGQSLIPVADLIPGFDATTQFHRYGVDWREDTIGWFIDDIEVFRMETRFHEPAYLLLDVAVGGWAGTPDFSRGTTDMIVRSVKVFA